MVEAARELLPWWVGWACWTWLPVLAVVSAASAWLGSRVARPKAKRLEQAHWTERARAAFAAQGVGGSLPLVLALVCAVVATTKVGPLSRADGRSLEVSTGFVCYASALLPIVGLATRVLGRELSYREIARSHLVSLLIMVPSTPLALLTIAIVAGRSVAFGCVVLLAGASLVVAASRGGGVWVAERIGLARRASPRLAALAAEASRTAGVPLRSVHEIPLAQANAVALPLARAVLFSERALEILADREVAAVCAHELGHVAEPRSVALGRVVPPLVLYLAVGGLPVIIASWRQDRLAVLAGLFGFLLAFVLVAARVFRRLERRADATAHAHEDAPGVYAGALEKLYKDSLTPAVLRGPARSHPHLYDRLAAASMTPPYPRPAPPPRWRLAIAMAVSAGPALGALLACSAARTSALESRRESGLIASLAFLGGGARELAAIGSLRSDAEDLEAAAVFYGAATALRPASVVYATRAAVLWGSIDRCDNARLHLEIARRRARARPSAPTERALGDAEDELRGLCPAGGPDR